MNSAKLIAAHKRIEESLRESKDELNAILQNTSAVIYLMDRKSRFLYVNRQFEELFQKGVDSSLDSPLRIFLAASQPASGTWMTRMGRSRSPQTRISADSAAETRCPPVAVNRAVGS